MCTLDWWRGCVCSRRGCVCSEHKQTTHEYWRWSHVSSLTATAGGMALAATSGKRRSFNTDLDHLRKCFSDVDHLKSGFIGLEELTKLVNSMPDSRDSVVAELMETLDRDKDGKVSLHSESGAHTCNTKIKYCISESKLKPASFTK